MREKLSMYALEPPGFDLANYEPFAEMNAREWKRELLYRYWLTLAPNCEGLSACTASLMKNPLTLHRPMFGDKQNSSGTNTRVPKQTRSTVRSMTVKELFEMVDKLDNNIEQEGECIDASWESGWPNEKRHVTYDSVMASQDPFPHRYATLMVDLDHNEKRLRKDFATWMKKRRAENKISNQDGRINMPEWHRLRIIPCCDLMEWARARDKQWSLDALASILSTDEAPITAQAVRRTIMLRIETVISIRMMAKLV